MLAHATILRTVSRTSSKVIKTQKTEDNMIFLECWGGCMKIVGIGVGNLL